MNSSTQRHGDLQLFRRLLAYVTPYRTAFALAIVTMVIASMTEASFAALMKPILDGSFVNKDPFWIRLAPFLIFGAALVRGAASYTGQYLMGWIGRNIIHKIRQRLFYHLLVLPKAFYDTHPTGHLLSKMSFDAEQLARASTQAITIIVRDSVVVVFLLGWMFYLNLLLSLVFLVIGPLIALLVKVVNQRFRRISKRIQDSMGDVTQITEQAIKSEQIIKTFNGQPYEERQFGDVNNRNRQQNMKLIATREANVQLTQLIVSVCLATIVYLATLSSLLDVVSVGTFVSFMMAMMMLMSPIKRLTNVHSVLQRGIAATDSLFSLIDVEPEPDHGRLEIARASGDIRYQDVSFCYNREKGHALHRISFHIHPGQTVAIVGRSGSGKTTLVSLLPRFYDPEEGCILLDGHDIRSLSLASLRAQVALVGQHVTIFNDTIAHNIAYGAEEMDEARLHSAISAAHVDEFIDQLPEGINTVVGENGMLLSGGQRQRLAIARAFYKHAPILILDEATSALDSESEKQIQNSLERLMGSCTTLVIAHRLSTIQQADLIMVMHEGSLVETGRHDELLTQDGYYRRLYQMQFGEAGQAARAFS